MSGLLPTKSSAVVPVKPGNIDLNNRPVVKNADGSISTVRSATFTNQDGTALLIPTVTDEGKILPPREALDYWRAKKQHLGIFKNEAEANRYAEQLHQAQAKQYGGRK